MLSSNYISRELEGCSMEILVQAFADRILVLVTQLGKIGTLIQATIPPTTPLLSAPLPDPVHPNDLPLPTPPTAIQLMPLLGNAPSEHMQTLHNLYVSQIATIVWTAESEGPLEVHRRSVVVGLALRNGGDGPRLTEGERKVFLGVMAMLRELLAQKKTAGERNARAS